MFSCSSIVKQLLPCFTILFCPDNTEIILKIFSGEETAENGLIFDLIADTINRINLWSYKKRRECGTGGG